jgi:hypothetical protein
MEAVLSQSRQATLLWYQLPKVSLGLRFTEPLDELSVFLVVSGRLRAALRAPSPQRTKA